jgi:NAD(P)H-dependent flavin oxidoreductase YrpB (nitropropane dioxygenase family)
MRQKSRIPILAMTANVMQAEVQQCLDAGMDGFVPKPFQAGGAGGGDAPGVARHEGRIRTLIAELVFLLGVG